jgi:hypothetical protein
MEGQLLPTKTILRESFLTELLQLCTSEEQRKDVEACMDKNYILNGFNGAVVGSCGMEMEIHEIYIRQYVRQFEDGSARPYAADYPSEDEYISGDDGTGEEDCESSVSETSHDEDKASTCRLSDEKPLADDTAATCIAG